MTSSLWSMFSICGEWSIFQRKKKHAVSPHDLKNFGISILSSKFKEFFKSYKHHYPLPNFKNYIDFEKILILLTYKRHIFEIFKISKKHFFLHFWLVLQVNLSVFLIGYKFCQILCATCPKIKIFIWDNILISKMIKSHLVCICRHVAQNLFYFYFRYRNSGPIEKKGGFATRFELFFRKFRMFKNFAKFCVPLVRISNFLNETIFWYLKW